MFDPYFSSQSESRQKVDSAAYNARWRVFRGLSHQEQAIEVERILGDPHRTALDAAIVRRWQAINSSNLPILER